MSRRTLPALLLLPLSFAPGWMDLARLIFAEILSEPGPTAPGDGNTDGGPGMDPWG